MLCLYHDIVMIAVIYTRNKHLQEQYRELDFIITKKKCITYLFLQWRKMRLRNGKCLPVIARLI